jgi:hypothetical protein
MHERLTNENTCKKACARIRELIAAHGEWLYAQSNSRHAGASLRGSDFDFRVSHGRLIFSCWTDAGLAVWRIKGWEWTGEKLLLEGARRAGAENALLELIPRVSFKALTANIADTRRERCQRLARLACASLPGAKVERVTLSAGTRPSQPGRYARILLRHATRERIAVTGMVAESKGSGVEAFLSSALIWFMRVNERVRPPYIQKLWLVVMKDSLKPLGKAVALLRRDLRRSIYLYQIDDEWHDIVPVAATTLDDLWRKPPGRFRPPPQVPISERAQNIVALAPEAIDVVRARCGETLRYRGLAFARVRRVMNRESVWFGTEDARRRLLDESTLEEWSKLMRDLREHRRAGALDTRHALYRAVPEAWLESELRRDITRLDPGLRLAPLHAQFRPTRVDIGSRPIDLLALRHDGRLAVIELKVSEDREHVLQGADYWLRTESYRRHGHLARARLFGDAPISDEPPLVYLVAPLLRFHRSFTQLARAITPEIEIYRFDLSEDWRASVRVVRRERLTGNHQ